MKKIEAIFSILAMLGALLVANKVALGWIVFLVSSLIGTYWSIKTKNYWVAIMQCFFTLTNAMGCINYLF